MSTAINSNSGAGCITGHITRKIQRSTNNFLWLTASLQWNRFLCIFVKHFKVPRFRYIRQKRTRHDAIHSDFWAIGISEGSRNRIKASLGCTIGLRVRTCIDGGDTADIDNRSTLSFSHSCTDQSTQSKRTLEIHPPIILSNSSSDISDSESVKRRHAGIIYKHIDLTECVIYRIRHFSDLGPISNVGGIGKRFNAKRLNFLGGFQYSCLSCG